MALFRAAGLCRLALRTQSACVRLLSSVTASDERSGGEDKAGRLVDLKALRRERALRPPAEPPKVLNTLKPSYQQVQLNQEITGCSSAAAVLDLVSLHPAVLNAVNVSTALLTIGKVVGQGTPAQWLESDARFQQLLGAAVQFMKRNEFTSRGYADLIDVCGQLDIAPPELWLESFWRASGPMLRLFTAQGLSKTLHVCGQLDLVPPAYWLQHFWRACFPKLSTFTDQELSTTFYACAKLGFRPRWAKQFWDAGVSKLDNVTTEQGLSHMLVACGQLRVAPHADWLARYCEACEKIDYKFSAQHWCSMLYAFGLLNIAPPAPWLRRYWKDSISSMGELTAPELSNTLYACGKLGIKPPADWFQHYWEISLQKVDEILPAGLSNLIFAFAKLGIEPPADWTQRYWEVSTSKLGDYHPTARIGTLGACSRLGIIPPADWLKGFWQTSTAALGVTLPHYLSYAMLACANLGVKPPEDWMQRFWEVSIPQLRAFPRPDITMTSFARLNIEPPAAWTAYYELKRQNAEAMGAKRAKPSADGGNVDESGDNSNGLIDSDDDGDGNGDGDGDGESKGAGPG